MEPDLTNAVAILAVVTAAAAAALGYASQRSLFGAAFLGAFTVIAGVLCYTGVLFGGWIGLAGGVVVNTFLANRLGHMFGKRRGAVFVPVLWLGYCVICAIGYWAGGLLGLLTITLPAVLLFWLGLFLVSWYLLPLRARGEWPKAFRSLVTYSLGTNYPYHITEGGALGERVAGNPYGMLFSGPGLVLTDPAHAPVIWEGTRFKRVGQPGLTFTGRFETIYQVVDLRPQLRTFDVEAITKDGIRVHVLTFVPFQLDSKGQTPSFGSSFPVDAESVYKAMWQQPVEDGRKRTWDELVQITTTRIVRRVIGTYRFDDLCEALNPARDPRVEIRGRIVDQVTRELEQYGIAVLGGGIGNLAPADQELIRKRVDAWRADWQSRIVETLAEGQAEAVLQVEKAYSDAQAALITAVRSVFQQRTNVRPEILANMAALRFIEALEEMSAQPDVKGDLPEDTGQTIAFLKRTLGQNG